MLRLRKADGQTIEVEKGLFVELCDLDGNVAQVSFILPDGSIRVIDAKDKDAARYVEAFKGVSIKFCPITALQNPDK